VPNNAKQARVVERVLELQVVESSALTLVSLMLNSPKIFIDLMSYIILNQIISDSEMLRFLRYWHSIFHFWLFSVDTLSQTKVIIMQELLTRLM